MSGTTIDIKVDDADLKAGLKKLEAKLGNLKPFFSDIGEELLNSTRERFISQTDPNNKSWAELSPAYKASKPKHKDLILTLNGYLRGTLTKQADKDSLRIGSPMIYGATHQFGDPARNIPARPFLGLSDDDTQGLLDAIADYLAQD